MKSPLRCKPLDIPAHIFRAYDIRGISTTELTADVVHDIGLALGSEVQAQGAKSIIVGRDGRLSGPSLIEALKQGLCASGCDVIDIGIVPTPVLYFATYTLGVQSGVMLTGSHNPRDYNGLKMVVQGHSLTNEQIQGLYQRLQTNDYVQGQGNITEIDIIADYIAAVKKSVQLKRPLKIVVDAGNGVTGGLAPALFRALGCDVNELYCEVDGNFPNHHPDPSKPENTIELIEAVKKVKADIGLAFDGDGDRLGVVTPNGKVIWPDRQLMLYAQSVLRNHPGGTIIYDVKCSKHLDTVIREAGGVPLMYKTGHSLIKTKLKEVKAILAGEMSGHTFFNDKWYGFDDGMYVGARLLEILAVTVEDADTIFDRIPESVSTPELNIDIPDSEKFRLMQVLADDATRYFPGAKLITIDGLRVEFDDAWGLIRPSNTTPMLVVRFEADTEQALWRIKTLFRDFILEKAPNLDVGF
ncbi:MAG: phosphomannomutase/phosphoglucomutase [Gammaproteobacteria bacterium]|nr:phosphomannomutase/phosphoglucomutase [Gammaproteobacteria bacterium]